MLQKSIKQRDNSEILMFTYQSVLRGHFAIDFRYESPPSLIFLYLLLNLINSEVSSAQAYHVHFLLLWFTCYGVRESPLNPFFKLFFFLSDTVAIFICQKAELKYHFVSHLYAAMGFGQILCGSTNQLLSRFLVKDHLS